MVPIFEDPWAECFCPKEPRSFWDRQAKHSSKERGLQQTNIQSRAEIINTFYF